MELEELKERYKMLPLWTRLVAVSLLGVAPAIYMYFNQGAALTDEVGNAETQESAARRQFESARDKKANLPGIEEKLAYTEEQLEKARKRLPDAYRIEDVLQKTATIARETSVQLLNFVPGKEKESGDDVVRYMELPIKTEVDGKFAQVATFFDKVAHLESSIFLRNIELKSKIKGMPSDDVLRNETAYDHAKDLRQHTVVNATFDLVVFRSLTDAEMAANAKGKAAKDGKDATTPPKAAGPAAPAGQQSASSAAKSALPMTAAATATKGRARL